MSENKDGKVVFSGTVHAGNLQTGENASIHEGDNVSGDKVQGQQVAGDMSVEGGLNQTFGDQSPITPAQQFVSELKESYQSASTDTLFASVQNPNAYAQSIDDDLDLEDSALDLGNDDLGEGVSSDIPSLEDLGEEEADQVFGSLNKAAALSEDEIEADPEKKSFVTSAVEGFRNLAGRCAPRVGEAMLAGATAAIQATIRTHPVVAGVLATLEVFRKA